MVLENGKEVRIVADVDGIIEYEVIEKDTVNRQEVAEVKSSIEVLEREIGLQNAKLDELKAKLELAGQIIQLADEQKAQQEQEYTIEEDGEIAQEVAVEE